MSIEFFNHEIAFDHPSDVVKEWIKSAIEQYAYTVGEISFIFTNDDEIITINNTYLDRSYPTDVITFSYTEEQVLSGDIFISVDTVVSNAPIYNSTFENELHRVMIHGILHLMGYRDYSNHEKKDMIEREDTLLNLRYWK